MGIRWQIRFKSFLGTDYTLSIYDTALYMGDSITQLTGAANCFVTNEDDDEDLYMPVRLQSGTIRIVVEDSSLLNEIMPVQSVDRPVVLRDGSGTVKWVGFVSGEMFSQPWAPCPYELEIPVISVMMAMQGVEFTQVESWTSLFNLMQMIGNYMATDMECCVPTDVPIDEVFVQNNNFREYLTIAERALRSTNNKYECMTIYDCVEQFCLYFGVSLREYEGKFYFTTHNARGYEDMDKYGGKRQAQYGPSTINYLDLISAENTVDYSKAYRRVVGTFSTSREKVQDIFSIEAFLKQFSANSQFFSNGNIMLMNGNDEVVPYKNGARQVSWMEEGGSDTGGQIIRSWTYRMNVPEYSGHDKSDFFFVRSAKERAGSPQRAMVFNIQRSLYINSSDVAVLSISGSVIPWYEATQGNGFIKRLHCKVRVGDYWLKSEKATGSTLTSYSWQTSETRCWLMVNDGGSITTEGATYTIDYDVNAALDSFSGFVIELPSGLRGDWSDVYFELLANAEDEDDFKDEDDNEYAHIGYLISGLNIQALHAENELVEPTPDYDENKIIRLTSGVHSDDYTVDSLVTNKRGVQYGAGMALTSSKNYVSTKYDEQGIARRASAFSQPRKILTIDVRRNVQPIERVDGYLSLAQSIDWRDDKTRMRIINI